MHLPAYSSLGKNTLPSVTQNRESRFAGGIEVVEYELVRRRPIVPQQHPNWLLVRLLIDLYGEPLTTIFTREKYGERPLAAWLRFPWLILEPDIIHTKDITYCGVDVHSALPRESLGRPDQKGEAQASGLV